LEYRKNGIMEEWNNEAALKIDLEITILE